MGVFNLIMGMIKEFHNKLINHEITAQELVESCFKIIEKKDSKINVCSVLDAIFISEHGSSGSGLSDSAVFLLEGLKKTSGRLHQFEFGSIMVYLKLMNPATIHQHRWNSDSLGQRADGKTG